MTAAAGLGRLGFMGPPLALDFGGPAKRVLRARCWKVSFAGRRWGFGSYERVGWGGVGWGGAGRSARGGGGGRELVQG